MGNCGLRSKAQVQIPGKLKRQNPISLENIRITLLEMKQIDKAPVLNLDQNKLHVRRLLGQTTMEDSSGKLTVSEEKDALKV